ncbi:MAG: ADP-ribosylglycohydrolase family protein [Actinomycetota bacterium]|nr:ADP-ribosylglycohydrolase family protein [Actinomycetota bacterium]
MSVQELEQWVDSAGETAAPSSLGELYRGTLLGVAAGNALGIPAEGHSRRSVERSFHGGPTEVDPSELGAPWDDDLAQTAVLAEALAEGELDPDDLARRFVAWGQTNGRGIGHLTSEVLDQLTEGESASSAARVVWERRPLSSAGNGALMRCSPVALRWRTSGRELIRDARASALVTHYDPLCEWSTVAMCLTLAVTLSGAPVDLDLLSARVDATGAPDEVAAAIRTVGHGGLRPLALDDPMDMGYTIKAMQVGLWAATQADADFAAVLTEVVGEGGDTDTNGAIAGAVMGARLGAGAIPSRWLDNIAGTDRLVELADALLEKARL